MLERQESGTRSLEERNDEVLLLEGAIIDAWVRSDGYLPQAAFVALMSSAKIACDPGRMTDTESAAADRALERLRQCAEAVRTTSTEGGIQP